MIDQKRVTMLLSNPYRPDPRVRKEAISLTEEGHAMTIIAWDRIGSSPERENTEGINVIRLGPRSAFDNMLSILVTLPLFYLNAFRKLAGSEQDVIHCHDFDTLPIGFLVSKLRGIRIVYDSHERYPDMIAQSVPGCLVALISLVESALVRRVDAVIVPSPPLKKDFQKIGADTVVTVMNCAELLPPPDSEKVKRLRDSLTPSGETLVVYIGTLERIRGLEEIVLAFHKHSKGEFKLVMGGFGPLENRLKNLCQISDYVTFIGPVKPEIMRVYNHASDVMLMLSDSGNIQTKYGLANKIFEAMSAGKPIIVSRHTLHEKIVLDSGSGLSVKYFDGSTFFEVLRQLRDDRELYVRLSRNGLKSARTRYNWGVMAMRLKRLYRSL